MTTQLTPQMAEARIAELPKGFDLPIFQIINSAFKLFGENVGQYLGFMVLLSLFTIIGQIHIVLNIFISLMIGVLNVGFYEYTHRVVQGNRVDFNAFFNPVKTKFFPLIFLSLFSGIITFIGFVILIIPGIYLTVGFLFAAPLLYFFNYDILLALGASLKLTGKSWFQFFLFGIILLAINVLGLLALVVGLLVTVPVSFIAIYLLFEHCLKLNDFNDKRLDTLGRNIDYRDELF